ncbi:MAG: signal peptidase I [Nitrospirae bacterium]|nr:signal peptidase I [Nitrospirota bacterium]
MREIGLDRDELGVLTEEIIGRGGSFSFKAHGWSMYPFIHDGDILTVGPVSTNELKSGDIILYKSLDDGVVVHRVIGKTKVGNTEILKVRGDALIGSPEYIATTQVIGKAIKQRRTSNVVDLQKGGSKFLAHIWLITYPIGSSCLYFVFTFKKFLSLIFRFFQSFSLYRKLAQILIGKKVNYLVIVDDLALLDNKLKESFSLSEMASKSSMIYNYEICAYIGQKKVGSVALLKFDEGNLLYPDWWLFGMEVRIPYRGAGIGKNLLHMAINKAFEVNANKVNLLVFKTNHIAINLYKKMGFKKISIPALDEQLEKEAHHGHSHRIIMSRSFIED